MHDRPKAPPRIGRGAMVAGAANLLGRISGLARDIVFTWVFGAGMVADAYFAAFRVPSLLRELLAEGTLANVFVPLFAETEELDGLKAAWGLANVLIGVLLVILGICTLGFFVFAEPFVYLVAAGYDDVPGKIALATWLTRILAPFLAGLSLAALFGGMLNVRGKFFLPAIAPALLNVFVIAGCLLGAQWEAATGTPAIGAVALAATLSGLLTAAVQYPALRRDGFRFRPVLRRHPGLMRIAKFVAAALIGIVVVQFNLLVEMQLASRFGDGPVSYMVLGFRLVQLPMGVVAASVAVASLANLSVLFARGEKEAARTSLARALEMNALLVVPSAIGLYLLADPLIRLCFERGAFSAVDTAATAGILRMYAFAVVGICMFRVLLPAFFALKDPYVPMKLALVVMAVKIPIAFALMYPAGLSYFGLPLSHAITVTFEVVAMLWILSRRLDGWAPGFWSQQLRIVLASIGMGGAVWGMRDVVLDLGPQGIGVIVICAGGAAVYALLAWGLGIREARGLIRRVMRRPGARP